MVFLSVIIPAYNEEKRLSTTLHDVSAYLRQQPYGYEVLVVSDGSTDKTVEVVSSFTGVRILHNEKNHGKGFVVRQGLLAARGQYRLFMDADNATPISEVSKLLEQAKKYDVVVGSRSIKGSRIAMPQPFYRRFLGKCYVLLTALIAGLHGISDTQCGFKLLSAKCAGHVLPMCRANGWSFDVEILLVAKKHGYFIKEVPVNWSDGKGSRMSLKGMVLSVIELVKIRWNAVAGKYNN